MTQPSAKKIIRSLNQLKLSLIHFSICSIAIFGMSGCNGKQNAEVAKTTSATSSSMTSVCGIPPSGDLIAQRIVSANTTRTEPGLYEGPVWIKDALYFSDFTFGAGFPSRIQKLDANGVMTTFIDDSGSNGLAVDVNGNIIAGTHKFKSLSRYDLKTKARTSVAEKFNGNVFNSPNDLVIAKDGTVYFTDPDYQTKAAEGGQDKTRVYRVAVDGTVTVVDDSLKNPNGIALSLDEKILYVNGLVADSVGVVRAYSIVDGIPQTGSNLISGLAIPDGMVLDCYGNLYVTDHTQKLLNVYTPNGEKIATIHVDANITNAAFGGADRKTLFLTGAGAVWKIELDVNGLPY